MGEHASIASQDSNCFPLRVRCRLRAPLCCSDWSISQLAMPDRLAASWLVASLPDYSGEKKNCCRQQFLTVKLLVFFCNIWPTLKRLSVRLWPWHGTGVISSSVCNIGHYFRRRGSWVPLTPFRAVRPQPLAFMLTLQRLALLLLYKKKKHIKMWTFFLGSMWTP